MARPAAPVRIAIVDDYQVVVEGVARMLEPFADRVVVVELDSRLPTVSDVDVVLYDTFGQVQGSSVDVDALTSRGSARVVIYSWNLDTALVDESLEAGVAGYLWKGMPAEDLVAAIEQVHAGQPTRPPAHAAGSDAGGDWPGRAQGLSARESEVVALIAQGLSNQEIADRAYLSINSVKTYIRTAYRKIGLPRRAQVVAWALQHGFEPDTQRSIAPSDDN